MSLINRQGPDFEAPAVIKGAITTLRLSQYRGRYVVLFFYPLDFTFVCPTELHTFQELLPKFEEMNSVVLGCSVDSAHSHYAWLQQPKAEGGIQGITYPIISDLHKTISRDYGVLWEKEGVALRGTFLLDKEGVVRHSSVNDLPLGRNVAEYLRLLEALQYTEKYGEVCPANWNKGDKTMRADAEGVKKYFRS